MTAGGGLSLRWYWDLLKTSFRPHPAPADILSRGQFSPFSWASLSVCPTTWQVSFHLVRVWSAQPFCRRVVLIHLFLIKCLRRRFWSSIIIFSWNFHLLALVPIYSSCLKRLLCWLSDVWLLRFSRLQLLARAIPTPPPLSFNLSVSNHGFRLISLTIAITISFASFSLF